MGGRPKHAVAATRPAAAHEITADAEAIAGPIAEYAAASTGESATSWYDACKPAANVFFRTDGSRPGHAERRFQCRQSVRPKYSSYGGWMSISRPSDERF